MYASRVCGTEDFSFTPIRPATPTPASSKTLKAS